MSFYRRDNILEDYLNYLNNLKLNKSSVLSYYFDFKIYLIQNNMDIKSATETKNIIGFINDPTIKFSTKKRRHVSIKKILLFLDQKGYIDDINCLLSNIKYNNTISETAVANEDILSEEQIQKLLDFNTVYSNFSRDKAIIETIYTLGLRTEELINIEIKDVDINLRLLSFYRNSTKKTLTLDNKYNSSLINYIINDRTSVPLASKYLFVSRNNDKFSRQSIWKIINKVAQISGIKAKVTPKILRKSFAISLVKKGVPVGVVSEFFGVQNINFLLRENIDKREYFDLAKYYADYIVK